MNISSELLKQIKDLSPDDYWKHVFRFSEDHYKERVKMVGFQGAEKVLDIGCGYGQWTAALAHFNGYVVGIDRNPRMIEASNILCNYYGLANVAFKVGGLPNIDFQPNEFDMIWCSLILEYIERESAFDIFYRCLKPGGKIYVATNSRGRWLYKMFKHASRFKFKNAKTCWRTFCDGRLRNSRPGYLTLQDIPVFCSEHGFKLIAANSEGYLDISGQQPPRCLPMFPKSFLFWNNNIEFVAEKLSR